MRRRFASYRFRRRFAWVSALVLATTGVIVTAALIGNTGEREPERFTSQPAKVYRSPKLARLRPADRARLLQTSLQFVRTAVVRRHLDRAYELAGPALTQGMSRSEWETGNIPVVPFPAIGVAAWNVAYSYDNDVAFNLSLVAKPGASPVIGKTFTIELKRRDHRSPWLVASWFPTGISGIGNDPTLAAQVESTRYGHAALSLYWLALPVGLLALILVVPAGLGVRHWWVGRRSERQYLAERGRWS